MYKSGLMVVNELNVAKKLLLFLKTLGFILIEQLSSGLRLKSHNCFVYYRYTNYCVTSGKLPVI